MNSTFMCGECAKKFNLSLDERKKLASQIPIGENVCKCGRTIIYDGMRMQKIKAAESVQ